MIIEKRDIYAKINANTIVKVFLIEKEILLIFEMCVCISIAPTVKIWGNEKWNREVTWDTDKSRRGLVKFTKT